MKERPILMNAFSVKAILEGRKTQTRRVIKPQPVLGRPWKDWTIDPEMMDLPRAYCRHGIPRERLWVSERHAYPVTVLGAPNYIRVSEGEGPVYRADGPTRPGGYSKWRPSIFTPRWVSRITLEITDVRVERVQDITEEDAIVEGLERWRDVAWKVDAGSKVVTSPDPVVCFQELWDSINVKRGFGWETNPWVWVISFRNMP